MDADKPVNQPTPQKDGTIRKGIGVPLDVTECKRIEEALQESEERFRVIFDNALDGILLADIEDKRFFSGNAAICKMLKYSLEEIRQKWVADIHPKDNLPYVMDQFGKLTSQGGGLARDIPVLRKDSSIFYADINSSVITVSGRKYLLGIFRDITDRKKTEEALRESESKFRLLAETANEGILVAQEGMLKFVNPKSSEISGYSEAEMTADPYTKFIHPDDREMVLERRMKRLRNELSRSDSYMFRIIRRDGDVRWIEMKGALSTWDGEPATVNFITDVTERKKVEEELLRSESRYRHIFNSAAVSIWEEDFSEVKAAIDDLKAKGVTDFRTYLDDHPEFARAAAAMTRVLDVNDATLALYGAKNKGELMHALDRVFTGESYGAVRELLIAIAEGKTYFETETVNRTLQGEPLAVLLHISIPAEAAEFRHLLVSIVDMTERKRLEENLQRSQKLESLGVLAGGIAHDFNNLLTVLLGNINLARMSTASADEKDERLEESEKAILRAKNLTRQLLTFSKGGAPVKKSILLSGVLRDSVQFSLMGSNVKGEFILEDDSWPVEADEGQIVQVFNNLVINACQAMPRGGTLRVNAGNDTVSTKNGLPLPDGDYVKVSIRDRGTGIPREHLRKIFDPYFTTKEKGSGLGLAVAHAIVRNHKGCITVDSKSGEGSTFTVYLPATRRRIAEKPVDEERCIVGGGRILLMDDEATVRNVAGEILKRAGYDVVFAADGTQAIVLFEQAKGSTRPFDAVIMDLTVPGGMGGKELIGRLRELDPGLKAIVSSGYSNDPVLANYREYGFDGVVAKPYTSSQLSKTLRRTINGTDADSQ